MLQVQLDHGGREPIPRRFALAACRVANDRNGGCPESREPTLQITGCVTCDASDSLPVEGSVERVAAAVVKRGPVRPGPDDPIAVAECHVRLVRPGQGVIYFRKFVEGSRVAKMSFETSDAPPEIERKESIPARPRSRSASSHGRQSARDGS